MVRAVTHEEVTHEELGGARVHAGKSGVADGAFDNDLEALTQVRRLVDFLPLSNREKPPIRRSYDDPAREEVADEIAARAGADVLCYFADGPDSLVELQVLHWGPMLDWASAELGLELVRVSGLIHRPQPEATIERVRSLALDLSDFELTGLVNAAGLFGSAILAFALQRGRLTGDEALDLSRLDETFQEERWGVDEEAAARTAHMRAEATVLEQWFAALRR